ncbi:hypothetical protein QR680_004708 [Steinernema hermaphroditum]|uniref:EB domain-containing protein n=1 Tax=Steinernema hermaphroditum TaxID=289476 RepID=A0AA39LUF3_9BILA|nr:hypothetical protein QR680_004708 [Steinernema hermaphroditum]
MRLNYLHGLILIFAVAGLAYGESTPCQNDEVTTQAPCDAVTEAVTTTEAPAQPPCNPAAEAPTTEAPCDSAPSTEAPTTEAPCQATTEAPTTEAPQAPCDSVTEAPATEAPTTEAPCQVTTEAPTTKAPCAAATTEAPKSPCSQRNVARNPAAQPQEDEKKPETRSETVDEKAAAANVTCKSWNKCYSNSDCGKGTCLGASISTCHCYSCIHFYPCSSDEHCGGFKNACNLEKGECDCYGAYEKNGLKSFGQALIDFCYQKKCEPNKDDCFGLPCKPGKCFC